MTDSCVRHDSITCATCLIHMCAMSPAAPSWCTCAIPLGVAKSPCRAILRRDSARAGATTPMASAHWRWRERSSAAASCSSATAAASAAGLTARSVYEAAASAAPLTAPLAAGGDEVFGGVAFFGVVFLDAAMPGCMAACIAARAAASEPSAAGALRAGCCATWDW